MSIRSAGKRLLKNLSARTGVFEYEIFRRYPYMFSPQQLQYLTGCLVEVRNVPGCVVEAGCASGRTTAYLHRFMAEESMRKEYIALDTFSGFMSEHAAFEITHRGKRANLGATFAENSQSWFDHSMQIEGIRNVRSIAVDVATFDFGSLEAISFCLLDVDLYLPIKAALPRIYDHLSPGGIIVVDDCAPGGDWDGALLAYNEYCTECAIAPQIHFGKLGTIRKGFTSRPDA
jgi:SAM-dependent methyltransferase